MGTSGTGAAARPRSVTPRRRGPVLERAILDAALEQLSTVGWGGLTMEGVAAGARTGKAAVYRRWPSKEDLVADALEAGLPSLETRRITEVSVRTSITSPAGCGRRCTRSPDAPCVRSFTNATRRRPNAFTG